MVRGFCVGVPLFSDWARNACAAAVLSSGWQGGQVWPNVAVIRVSRGKKDKRTEGSGRPQQYQYPRVGLRHTKLSKLKCVATPQHALKAIRTLDTL